MSPERYLDVSRSVFISSPAGSGKTEKLARRYVQLLREGSPVERILSITFTEKAAAEMKDRIVTILGAEDRDLLASVREHIPMMRISTIHAFCLKVLKRFAVELGLDPSLSVMEESAARNLWTEALYETLMAERRKPGTLFDLMAERGLRGWSTLRRSLDVLYAKRPLSVLLLGQDMPEPSDGPLPALLEAFRLATERYDRKKRMRHLLDFDDLELMTYDALSRGPEWNNLLRAFDEHTDHILVDEFQDTSTLQWLIIDKLTEEWRSGLGAKRDAGGTPTVFLVGDEKQSIYLFRGANVSVFQEARKRFARWLGTEYHDIEVRENYRSLPAIVDFTNAVFEHIMPPDLVESFMTRYTPFRATRQGQGLVELLLLDAEPSTKDTRVKEADVLARTINDLAGRHAVVEGEETRPCRFEDMAVLLRNRTHLGLFEDALRRAGISFVVLKGVGFYDEPEVAVLRELVCFLVDPGDDYSLFCLLRSPLFDLDHPGLTRLLHGTRPLMERLRESKTKRPGHVKDVLESWLAAETLPLAVRIERALMEAEGWRHFAEPQRRANIKKFIALIEGMEAEGLAPIEVRERLLRQRGAREVPKANISAEGMNAVRLMTIHAAKGLQFPMVFLPSLEERVGGSSSPVVLDDSEGLLKLYYEEDSSRRRGLEPFRRQKLKELEEEKRLFYVAVTRARDYLCMLGSLKKGKASGRLEYVHDTFDILAGGKRSGPLRIRREADLHPAGKREGAVLSDKLPALSLPDCSAPLEWEPSLRRRNVTEVEADIRTAHGEQWVSIGNVMHRLLEEISDGALDPRDLPEHTRELCVAWGEDEEAVLPVVIDDMDKLTRSGLMKDIVLPRADTHTELPFVLQKGNTVYSGRVDRVLITEGVAHVYDYKSFPVKRGEMPRLLKKYRFQMDTYAEAVGRLFAVPARAFLVFTHLPKVVPM